MKFSLSWLREHLATEAGLDEIVATLTRIGLEVEGVHDPAETLGGFRIARVVEAVQHPNADRLRACKVDTGAGIVSVVCGAPNARTGMKAVFAAPGSYIPGTGITLQVGNIRGVESAGMLLSAREMGLGDDHTGIVDLPEDAPVGVAYVAWAGMDDPVVEIAVTPNRGDALAVRGIARDLAAAGLGMLKPWAPAPVAAAYPSPLQWRIEFPEACPWVLGRAVRGVRNGPSPDWLVRRLTSIGLRPINRLVDITNFFTFDLGRPLHVFDVGKVAGGVLTLRQGNGESLLGLHGREVTLSPEDCAIADANGVVSLAGVVGGEPTGCDEATREVFIECALFDPVHVALSGRRHGVSSDARQRFERGIDPALMPAALEAATRMVIELCGGEASETVAAGAEPRWQRNASLRFARLESFGGLAVAPDEAVARLERLGFGMVVRDAQRVVVSVPSWRNDVAQDSPLDPSSDLAPEVAAKAAAGRAEMEPEADLVEEVLRLGGLDAVPPVSMPGLAPIPSPTLTPAQSRAALARRVLAARGLAECVTFSFMPAASAALFAGDQPLLAVENPISADLDTMRPAVLATLALTAARNAARGEPQALLFEVGPEFGAALAGRQRLVATGLRAGATARDWAAPSRAFDAMDAKADLWALLAALGVPLEALSVTADAAAWFHPGQSGVVRQGPKIALGSFGVLHPRVCTALDLPPAAGFVLDLDAIAEPKRRRRAAPELSALQPVRRDFAFLVDAGVPAETLLRAARGAERNLVSGVLLFDRYEGEKLPAGKVSLAIEVTLQPREKTLADAEIEAASRKIVAAVAKATGAVLRG